MKFSDIRGNDGVASTLRGMVDTGRIPHAILLHEDDGGGAFVVGQAFLSYLYCRDRKDGDACGVCPACNKVAKMIHPDIHYVFPVAGRDKPLSGQFLGAFREKVLSDPYFFENDLYAALGFEGKQALISVGEAKALLDKLSLSGVEGGYRSVVLYLPEKMNVQAANALLKMVEEPPENTLFLLITHAPEKVLTTIYSRCLFMRVLPLPEADGRTVHRERTAEDSALMDLFADLFDALASKDLLRALEAGDALAALESREKQKSFCKFAGECLRWIFLTQQGFGSIARVPEPWAEFIASAAARSRKTFPRGAAQYFDRAMNLLERNVNQKILFTDLVAKLFRIV